MKTKKPDGAGVEIIFRVGLPVAGKLRIGLTELDDAIVRRGLAQLGPINVNDTEGILGQLSRAFSEMRLASLEPPPTTADAEGGA